MQALEGYFENGQCYVIGKPLRLSGRRRAIITILDEPVQENIVIKQLAEFDRLVDESADETLHPEDFPRIHFGRDLVTFTDEDENA